MGVKKGYKQTEVGVIPEDWILFTLGQISEFVTSGSRGWASYYAEVGAIFVRSQNVRDGRLDFSDLQLVRPPVGAEVSRTRLNYDDLVVTVTGNSVGNVARIPRDLGEAYVSQHVGLVRLKEPSFAEYVCRFLTPFAPGNLQIWSSQSGQSKPGLKLTDLRGFVVALPPTLAEQEAIAGALSDADAWIESLEQLIAKKRQVKQGAMQELLTGKRRLPGFSGEWETKRLGDHCQFLRNGTNSRAELTVEGSLRYLHYGDIHSCKDVYICPKSLPSLPTTKANTLDRLQDGDLVFADASEDTIGISKSVEIVKTDGVDLVAGLHTIAVRFSGRMFAPRFAGYLQHCPNFSSHLRKLAAGTKVYATNRSHISSAEVCIPPLNEQTAIATILSDMEREIESLEQKLSKAREIKQGMMQELLTGRIRLV